MSRRRQVVHTNERRRVAIFLSGVSLVKFEHRGGDNVKLLLLSTVLCRDDEKNENLPTSYRYTASYA